ncbi:hypothetical protein BGZ59_010136 [Podila verticillata]|nr:hypothetical protein BGZ59_010136 [Podila verticillata]
MHAPLPTLPLTDSKSVQGASPNSSDENSSTFEDPVTSPGISLDSVPSPAVPVPDSPTKDSSNSISSSSLPSSSSPQPLSPSLPQSSLSTNETNEANDMKLDAISSASSGHTPSNRQPFAAGSLLQQRAEAEKQEIENMKMQLRLREQAGVLGAKNFNTDVDPPAGYYHHRPKGGLTGITGSNSASSFSSLSSSALHQPLKFGGPGTLIEKGETRAAQLLERSKSAGTGLLHPPANIGHNSYRSRSKSRPGEDRSGYYSGSSSPRSTGSVSSGAPSPNGPLLHFEDENAMIKPGLLLDRAKSAKQASGMSGQGFSRGYSSNGAQAGSRGRQASSNSSNTAHSSNNGRTRIKPLIDLGNIHTGQDLIGPGLLTNAHSSRPAATGAPRSPRRNKPLLEF